MQLVVLLVLVLYAAFAFHVIRKLCVQSTAPFDPERLSHDAITTILDDMNHPGFNEGVCYGFTLNWALAVAKEQEESFYQTVDLLRQHQNDLPETMAQIKNKEQLELALTPREQQLQGMPAFCHKVCVAQDPLAFKQLYGKSVWQPDINNILQQIGEQNASVGHYFYKTHTFASREQALAYFNLLKTIGLPDNTAVIISTADHAMGFKQAGELWRFIDINNLYKQQKDRPYFTFRSAELVAELYRVSTRGPLSRRLTVNTDFIAQDGDPQLLALLQNVFPVFPLAPKTTYHDKLSFFAMAALQGDLYSVRKCISSGLSIFAHHEVNNSSPIITAIYLGRHEVVKAMISATAHRINYKRKKDGATLLHLACRHSSHEVIEELAAIKDVRIDARDRKGRTPLMLACKSELLADDVKTMALLIKKGASLAIKDAKGATAVDHARKHQRTGALGFFNAEQTFKSTKKSTQVLSSHLSVKRLCKI